MWYAAVCLSHWRQQRPSKLRPAYSRGPVVREWNCVRAQQVTREQEGTSRIGLRRAALSYYAHSTEWCGECLHCSKPTARIETGPSRRREEEWAGSSDVKKDKQCVQARQPAGISAEYVLACKWCKPLQQQRIKQVAAQAVCTITLWRGTHKEALIQELATGFSPGDAIRRSILVCQKQKSEQQTWQTSKLAQLTCFIKHSHGMPGF